MQLWSCSSVLQLSEGYTVFSLPKKMSLLAHNPLAQRDQAEPQCSKCGAKACNISRSRSNSGSPLRVAFPPQNSEEKRLGGTGAPPTRMKPTRALLVTGFVRPFTVGAAQNLFKTYGVLPWLG